VGWVRKGTSRWGWAGEISSLFERPEVIRALVP
jgi:hypothetical protein